LLVFFFVVVVVVVKKTLVKYLVAVVNVASVSEVLLCNPSDTAATSAVLWPFGQDYLGEPVSEETSTQSHLS